MTCQFSVLTNILNSRVIFRNFSVGIFTVLVCIITINTSDINVGIIIIDPNVILEQSTANAIFQRTKVLFTDNITQSININIDIYKFETSTGLLHEFDKIFANASIGAIVAFVPYRYVQILQIFATDYTKPLVVANNFLPHQQNRNILSMYNGFSLTSEAVVQYLESFQWQNVVIITADDTYWRQMAPVLENQLTKQGFNVKHSHIISNMSDSSVLERVLAGISFSEKAVLLAMEPEEAMSFLELTENHSSVFSHAYFLISRTPFFNTSLINQRVQDSGKKVYQTLFVIYPMFPSLSSTVIREPNVNNYVMTSLEQSAICIFQGIYLLANESGTLSNLNNMLALLDDTSFTKGNNSFQFFANGERNFYFALLDIETDNNKLSIRRIVKKDSLSWKTGTIDTIDWPDNIVLPPDACFKGINCTPVDEVNIGLAVGLPLTLIVFIAVGAFFAAIVWKKRRKISMTKGPNKILLEETDLTYLHKKEMKSNKITNGTFLDKPDLVKASEKSNRSMVSLHELSDFSEIARYKGDVVYVKEIHVKGFEMKGKLLSYIRSLRDTRHENVNPLYGFLIDPLRPAFVSEYCSRGSLWDVLKNENIKLDWDFKVSLLTDLVRGLRYIQGSPVRCHGDLKSRNCVIDSRWVLKLTDYGMPKFKEVAKMTANYDYDQLLWMAPEHLRDPFPGMKGSEKGDIYSLSIVMQEVILRLEPYGMVDYESNEIVQRLRNPPPLLRPKVSPQAAPPQYIVLMKECWSENPEHRPAIEDVYQQFKSIAGGKKMNIVDSMFRMLEKYSNDLEDIVKERTVQLEEEKKKTDVLLFRMLPATVAEKLKAGKPIEAESFSEVTIYFSDIVGFTTISAKSTPMQVVDLLNDLYTMFDATIDIYDVYKVETIGDAYMVVSGLPMPNANRHAGEISTMALDLLSQCGTFTIRHMPEVPLRLRIGLHSGSCVAGVVGLTMPRYCLFGDTVNTASRMESTGAAFRIHISQSTKDVLDVLKGYSLDYRGEVELKGKGIHKTYWLVGKDGFNKPLPEPPPLNDLESVMNSRKTSEVSCSEKGKDVGSRLSDIQSNSQISIDPSQLDKQDKERKSKKTGKFLIPNDNFSNINDENTIKTDVKPSGSSEQETASKKETKNHSSNCLISNKKDGDGKKGNNYRLSKYSNASIDSVGTEGSVISTSELHMTVLSKYDDLASNAGSPGNLSPVAEV